MRKSVDEKLNTSPAKASIDTANVLEKLDEKVDDNKSS